MKSLTVFTDGGSRGNPGESGIGVVIYDEEKKLVWERGKAIGVHTNNEAEYLALDLACDWLMECKNEGWKACLGLRRVYFKLDSKLVVEQMRGSWKVKEPRMQELKKQVKKKLEEMSLEYEFIHVPREQNKRADELVNQALDLHLAK